MAKLRLVYATACIFFGMFWIAESHLLLPQIAFTVGGWNLVNPTQGFSYSTEILLTVSLIAMLGVFLVAWGFTALRHPTKKSLTTTAKYSVFGVLALTSLNFISYYSLPKDDLLTYKMPMGNCGGFSSWLAQKTSNPLWVQATREFSSIGNQFLLKQQDEVCAEMRIGEVVAEKNLRSCRKMGFESAEACLLGLANARDEFYASTSIGRMHRMSNWISVLDDKKGSSIDHALFELGLNETQKLIADYSPFANRDEIQNKLKADPLLTAGIKHISANSVISQIILSLAQGDPGKVWVEYYQSTTAALVEREMTDLLESQQKMIQKDQNVRKIAADVSIRTDQMQAFEALKNQITAATSNAELFQKIAHSF